MANQNKQIILINAKRDLVEYFINETEYQIVVLIASKEILDSFKGSPRVKSCILNKEIYNMNRSDHLSYEVIEQYKHTQLKAENCFDRQILDYQIKKSQYYFSLSFWNGIFTENEIDTVIIDEFNHGSIVDGIPHDMAIFLGINTYVIEPIMLKKNALKKSNFDEYLLLESNESVDLKSSKQYKMPYNDSLDLVIKNYINSDNKFLKTLLKKTYKVGGALAFEFLYCIYRRNFTRKNSSSGVEYSFWSELRSFHILRRNKKYLNSISEKKIPDNNFVFYALHFEPEASLNARVELESQLIIISMISECLPDGWELVIKEHPHQFELNNTLMYYYINTAPYFKSKNFYRKIQNMEKVRILDYRLNSIDIIKQAKAVATINGTIAAEAQDYNKPVMVFSKKSTILRHCRDILHIDGYETCKAALIQIEQGFTPDYSDIREIAQKYLVNESEIGRRTIFEHISKDILI